MGIRVHEFGGRQQGEGGGIASRPEDARAGGGEAAIQAELVGHLVRQARTGFIIGTLTVVAVLCVLWNAAPRGLLLGWLAATALLTAPAFAVVAHLRRAPRDPDALASWHRTLGVAYGLAGAGWGSAALLLYPNVALPYQLFLLFVVGGSGVGGMAALAAVRPAYVAYLTATFLPMVAALLAGGSLSSMATGLLLLAFWAAALTLSAEIRALLVRSLGLRFENLELIADLSHAKDEAESASRAKSLLLANVSHELRTPLALILGPVRRLLGQGIGSAGERRDLETVERNAQVLVKHVNDLLDVAKLEAGRMELERRRIDVVALVRRTVSLFEPVARERRVSLWVESPEALALTADPEKLERVVLNLVSNAMKFAPEGGYVRATVGAECGGVVLAVEDDGPGVPPALRAAIFDRFRRGDDAVTQRYGGTGLGLAIAKELIERHGGRIEVGDGARGGAVFRVWLPTGAPSDAAASAAPAEPDRKALDEVARQTVAELRPRHEPPVTARPHGSQPLVLILEDNREMSRFLVDCLAPEYRVATAFDGRAGLEQALALRPDLILSDVMMPVMSGDALVRELRARPELEGVPIIVLTAKADDELRVRLLREGAQDFLTKPVAFEELRARVANCVMLKRTRDVLQGALSSQGRDLAMLADELAAANRAKDEFLAVLSHELRTPLTPILSWLFLLREGRLDAATTERAVATIERNARLEARIVEDLLDVSRAITGKLRLHVQPMALDPVVYAAIDSVRPAAEARGVGIDAVVGSGLGMVSGDPERLQQVVWNLLSNAIKFAQRGGRVEVRLEQVDDGLRLEVRDDGSGIDPALLPRLFDRFWQADSSTTRGHGGLGLGLAVVRHLVELHGGTVRAESDGKGQGATFTVTLPPLARAPAADDRPARASDDARGLRGLKVLVVDDDEDTCETVGAVLERAGAEVRTCFSASRALEVMDAWVPDVLLSDIAMPGEDGYTLIRKVRARDRNAGGHVPAIALSAYGRPEDRTRALSAGFQVHVGKPIEPSELVTLLASVVQ